jgi:hypothetical protein
VPDLGFFAGAPSSVGGSSAFGGGAHPGGMSAPIGTPPTSSFGTPAGSTFGTPAGSTFGTPAGSTFGTSAGSPFGTPAPWTGAAAAPPARSGLNTGWKVGVAAAVVLVLIGLVLGGRFGWQQFVADPVAPATLLGIPKSSGADVDAMASQIDQELGKGLSDGSKSVIALYSDGMGTGYLLIAVRGGSRPGDSSGNDKDPFDGWVESTQDGASCVTSPDATGMSMTMCTRGLWRRGVVVFGIAAQPLDPGTVVRATNEAWDAQ